MDTKSFLVNKIYIQEALAEFGTGSYSFTMKDSIYHFFNKGIFRINDLYSLLYEHGIFFNGVPIKIEYGSSSKFIRGVYGVNCNQLEKITTPGHIAGDVEVELISDNFFKESIKSFAYTGRISDIINQLMKDFKFTEMNISETGNDKTWQRPNLSESEFITQILLENAYSVTYPSTPFFT